MALVSEKVYRRGRSYKGRIRWAKMELSGGRYKVEKRRPFGFDSVSINRAEFHWITSYEKAATIWAYYHFGINGGIVHPLTGKTYHEQWIAENPEQHAKTVETAQAMKQQAAAWVENWTERYRGGAA